MKVAYLGQWQEQLEEFLFWVHLIGTLVAGALG